MTKRERLSASVDADLLAVAHAAVAQGRAASVSAWVNEGLRLRADQERRLRAIDAFVEAYEAEHGEITDDEIWEAERRVRARAVPVRGPGTGQTSAPRQGPSRGRRRA